MDLRKIQFTGGSSFTVTLPKDWVENAKMKAGDVVGLLIQADGSLAVVPHARMARTSDRYEIELSDDGAESTFRRIVAAYLSGFDVITIRSKRPLSSATRQAVGRAAKRIVGIEVVEEDSHSVTIQDFLDPREFHIDKGLRRMEALTKSMQQEAIRVLSQPGGDVLESLAERDDEVDRLHWMINKQYHGLLRDPAYAQKMGLTASQALNYLLVARLVERTADHARRIAENLCALQEGAIKTRMQSKIDRQANAAFQAFSEAMAAFHKLDVASANRIVDAAVEFRSSQDAVIAESLSLGGERILHVAYALESIGRTAAYSADVAETAINHAVAMRGNAT